MAVLLETPLGTDSRFGVYLDVRQEKNMATADTILDGHFHAVPVEPR